MAKKTKRKGGKGVSRKPKSEEELECFYCGGLVKDWNWRCPHCGKLFNSGKRAIAFFVIVIVICAVIGTSPWWFPKERKLWPLTIDEVHPAPGNTEAWVFAQPDVWFNLTHVLEIPLDREACARAYSITPELDGKIYFSGWNKEIMIYSPNNMDEFRPDGTWVGWLKPDTTYYVTITTECRDVQGNHLDREWNYWFKTESGG